MARPFQGDFRFGWSNIEAAGAEAKVTPTAREVTVEVEGGTTGLARSLWSLDARSKVAFLQDGVPAAVFPAVRKIFQETGQHGVGE